MEEKKICTICNLELPATSEFFHKMEKGKYGFRSTCKECNKSKRKIYTQTSDYKEKARVKQSEWRKNNPKKALEANRKNWEKNRDKYNENRKNKYWTDEEYRLKRIEYDKKHKESGKRNEVTSKPEYKEKARLRNKKRRAINYLKEQDYKRAAIWRDENRSYINKKDKERRLNISKSYVARTMRLNVNQLDDNIYQLKKTIILLKRELKSNNVKIK